MLTKEILTSEIQGLKEQISKGQQQLLALQQQCGQLASAVDQLVGALAMSEKYLTQWEAQESVPASNGLAPVPVPAEI
jgi:hypothetical protein